MACKNKPLNLQTFRGMCFAREKINYPEYKTCGNTNPYYKDSNFYYSAELGRNLNRCLVEDYWSDWLSQSISIRPNENLKNFYSNIVLYIKSMYILLTEQQGLTYSNLSTECTAILLAKRVLIRLLGEEEAVKIIALLKLNINCDCD